MKRLVLAAVLLAGGAAAGVAAYGCSKTTEKSASDKTSPPPTPTEKMNAKDGAKGGPPPGDAVAAPPVAASEGKPKVEGQGFVVEVQFADKATVGGEAIAKVVLSPTAGYHVNKDFPTKLTITAPAGVDIKKAELLPADASKFEETGATFEVAYTAKDAGAKQFEATFKFAVCTATTCDPKREKLAWNVEAKP